MTTCPVDIHFGKFGVTFHCCQCGAELREFGGAGNLYHPFRPSGQVDVECEHSCTEFRHPFRGMLLQEVTE